MQLGAGIVVGFVAVVMVGMERFPARSFVAVAMVVVGALEEDDEETYSQLQIPRPCPSEVEVNGEEDGWLRGEAKR